MTYGPSTNPLMNAEEYARLDRIRAHAMLSSVEHTYPAWTDDTTPRTDRPVRFGYVSRQCAFSRVRISIVTRSPFPPARAYW